MKQFDWSEWYYWPKMAFKMPQEFPTASLDTTKDFHILHSAKHVILSSKQKHTTGSWTHTDTHSHTQQQQLQTKSNWACHIAAKGQTLFSCAKFWPLQVIKKRDNFADTGLAVGTPASFDLMKACFKRMCWFGNWHKTDAFTKLGEPTIRAACTPQTMLDQHFWCLFCFFYQYLTIFPAVSLYPQQKHAYSALHPQALTEYSSPDFRRLSNAR